jgi:hypothetical protein
VIAPDSGAAEAQFMETGLAANMAAAAVFLHLVFLRGFAVALIAALLLMVAWGWVAMAVDHRAGRSNSLPGSPPGSSGKPPSVFVWGGDNYVSSFSCSL